MRWYGVMFGCNSDVYSCGMLVCRFMWIYVLALVILVGTQESVGIQNVVGTESV